MRIGCATATRRISFAEVDCFFASWMRHWRPPTGWRCETPPAGCCASGENEKKPAGKCTFLTGFFLHFHCARGLSFRFLKLHAERSLKYKSSVPQKGSRGDAPGAGVRGLRRPLLHRPQPACGKKIEKTVFRVAEWVQGRWPCCRGYGGRTGPCFTVPNQHAERKLKKQTSASQNGCRADGPAVGVWGARRPLPHRSSSFRRKREGRSFTLRRGCRGHPGCRGRSGWR